MRDIELEPLAESALRLALDRGTRGTYASQPMPGPALPRRHERSLFEAYLYGPGLCLILQ